MSRSRGRLIPYPFAALECTDALGHVSAESDDEHVCMHSKVLAQPSLSTLLVLVLRRLLLFVLPFFFFSQVSPSSSPYYSSSSSSSSVPAVAVLLRLFLLLFLLASAGLLITAPALDRCRTHSNAHTVVIVPSFATLCFSLIISSS